MIDKTFEKIKAYKIKICIPKCKKLFDIAGMQDMKLLEAEHMMTCLKANHPNCTYYLVNQITGKIEYEI